MALRGKSPRAQVPLRIPEATRARLEKAAKARSVSMNAEIGERLDRSFDIEDRLGGPQVVEILEVVGAAMRLAGTQAAFFAAVDKGSWLASPYCFDQGVKAAMAVFEAHRPDGEIVVPRANVAQVVGGDPEQSERMLQDYLPNIGDWTAYREMRKREKKK